MWIINEDNRMIIHEESEFTLRYKDDDWMSGAEWYKEYNERLKFEIFMPNVLNKERLDYDCKACKMILNWWFAWCAYDLHDIELLLHCFQ